MRITWIVAALAAVIMATGCGGGAQGPVPDALATVQASATPSVGSLLKASGPTPQNGFWWNPAESGRGYALEVQGNQIFMGAYMYEASGVPTWYLATLVQQADGAYKGTLNRYSGGQTLLGAYKAPSTVTAIANATLTFATSAAGSLTIAMVEGGASRTIPIERFSFSTPAFAAPVGGFQGGLWWNAAEGGRGYFIEVQGSQAFIGSFMYDASGQPVWYLTAATLQNEDTMQGVLQQFAGGQALAGAYKPSSAQQGNAGGVTFAVTSSTTANLTLPDGKLLAISRAVSAPAAACLTVKSGFAANIETVAANSGASGDTGGDGGGSGGDGGGAGAGGGLGKVLGGLMRVVDLSDNTLVGEAVTDSTLGLVTVKTCSRPGPFLLTLEGRAGAKYFDEGLNQLTDFGPGNALHALVDTWDEHVGVSPLTEAAYRYALNNFKAEAAKIAAGQAPLKATGGLLGLTKAQVAAANKLVAAEINARFTTNYQLISGKTLPTPIDQNSGNSVLKDNRYGRSAAVNGGLVKAAQFYNPGIAAPGLALAEQLARDLTDGRINGFALDGTQVAPADKTSYESVRLPLAGTIATNAISGRFALGTLLAGELRVEEEAGIDAWQIFGFPGVLCNGFIDEIALMSDRSVTVLRRFPTNVNGVCSFKFDSAENARVVKIKNFLTDVKGLSTGSWVAYAIKTDGTVYGWGNSECGKLGPQFPEGIYSEPQLIQGLRNVTAINTSYSGGTARDNTGSVYTWGSGGGSRAGRDKICATGGVGSNGQPFFRYHTSALQKQSISNVAEVFIQSINYFALTTDGIVYGWGDGFAGLLANSDGSASSGFLEGAPVDNPTPIAGLPPVRQLAFFSQTAFALLVDGRVMAWGDDAGKLLGNGVQRRTTRPTLVPGLANIATMAASYGGQGLRFQRADGAVLAWGGGLPGVLNNEFYTPTVVATPEPIRHIVGRGMSFSVFFASGKLGRDVNTNADVSASFR